MSCSRTQHSAYTESGTSDHSISILTKHVLLSHYSYTCSYEIAVHARIQKKIVSGGPTLITFFFYLMNVRKDPNTTISGPSSAHQRNAILMAFRRRADDGPTLNAGLQLRVFQGIRTSIVKKPYILVIFQRGSGPPVSPLDPRMQSRSKCYILVNFPL